MKVPKVMILMEIEKGNRTLIIGRELEKDKSKKEYHYFVYDSLTHNVKSPLPLHKNEILKMIGEML